ncbi:MAG: SAM-dependent methyltransferase [Alphaproteobacteria bacterium]|nr:SAM-dependent methyltransferase [Alphaproteobacteria bacterium]
MPRELAAADRNRDAIAGVLREFVPGQGTILEIASGGGQHAAHFAAEFAPCVWQPSEYDADRIALMNERFAGLDLLNLRDPVPLDVGAEAWESAMAEADPPVRMIFNVNMIHIAPWSVCLGLFAGAGRLLPAGGIVFLYGPFTVDGRYTSAGNEEFDQSLRARDPAWGLRELSRVRDAAADAGLVLESTVEMPVNNLSVVFRRT